VVVTVTPDHFSMVDYDPSALAAVAERLAREAGLPDELPITVVVDERTPMGRVQVTSLDPLQVEVESGAFEDPKHIRQLSEARVVDVLGLHFFQTRDRLDPGFGGPELDEELTTPQRVAWDTYAMGRVERLGYPAQRQRRLYHFRNRHGFTDAADAAFDRLWSASGLTWSDLTAISDGAAANGAGTAATA